MLFTSLVVFTRNLATEYLPLLWNTTNDSDYGEIDRSRIYTFSDRKARDKLGYVPIVTHE